ncbi:MAG TPA: histidine phosphatase family protein [Pilimelia sp.]|nr:histidine phosphatase family protein [Pilimelia sp.]
MGVELIYETRAVTTDDEAGLATGWLPGRLSPQGRALAEHLGRRRRDDDLAAVFVSDLYRAVETAQIAFRGSAVPVFPDARLRECNYGALNGAPTACLAPRRLDHLDEPFPGGESYRQVVTRTLAFLHDLTRGLNGRRVLVIAHSANRWALEHLLHGRALAELVTAPFDWREGWLFRVPAGLAERRSCR